MTRTKNIPLAGLGPQSNLPAARSCGRRLWWGLLMCLLTLAGPGSAGATTELRNELAKVSAELAKAFNSMNETSVSIGQFNGPPQLSTSAGPLFTKIFTEELQKAGLDVKPRSKYGIKGEYFDATDAATGKLSAAMKAEVVDRTNRVAFSFTRQVFGASTLATLFGLTVDLPTGASPEAVDDKLKESLDSPQVTISEARVSASRSSPYGVQVLVRDPKTGQYAARPAVEEEGQAFVKIARDEIYALRLINDTKLEAACAVTIDGLSMFAFSENQNYSHMVILPNQAGDILGWHRTNQKSDSFLVTEYSKSAVAQSLPNSSTVGVITVTFSAAWQGDTPPADEPPAQKGVRGGDATGRGPEIGHQYQEVARNIGVVRSTVSIRYTRPEPTDLPPP